jgi:hypothetical protein
MDDAPRRPLLQQSLFISGLVVQPGKRAAFPSAAHLVRPRGKRQQLLLTAIGMFLASAPEVFLRGFCFISPIIFEPVAR